SNNPSQAFRDISGDINSSYNRSILQLNESRKISQAPVIMNIGSGYYSSRPISYNSQAGSETWIKDAGAATSMHHDVNYAQGIDGNIELSGQESSYYQDDYYSQNSAAIQMKINEDVTEGSVHIGVLQGDSDPSEGAGAGESSDPLMNAWKNPSLEMGEDYIGTYHIEKNMTITTSRNNAWKVDYWLDCCRSGYFNTEYSPFQLISADEVFNYRFVDA
ncbi:MAG TPA: hypothetical protein VLB04_13100, partial [Methanotrichaceae archaeon]|nr:hypothetical protein [Methanotrichaceae archaeon]